VEAAATEGLPVGVGRIQADADPVGGLGPLPLEVLGRRDHGDAVHFATGDELGGEAQGEGGLACTGCRRGEEVARLLLEVGVEGLGLPGAEGAGGASGGALGIRGGEMLGGEGSDGGVKAGSGKRRGE
jgi:hypothetical protein